MKISRFKIGMILFSIGVFACSNSENDEIIKKIENDAVDVPDDMDPVDTNNTNDAEWVLFFEEEFDGDLEKWNIWKGGAFNEEIQLYNEEQSTLENGILTITAKREEVTGASSPFDETVKDFEFVSGRLETKDQFGPSDADGETEYRFIARIKLPKGNGMWPAFWSYSDPWPTNGEIDVLEARGNEATTFQSNIFYGVEANMPLTQNEDTEKKYELGVDITDDFHEYELIWTAEKLEILFDGQSLHTYEADSKNYVAELFGKKQQIALNLAVGGAFFTDSDSADFVESSSMQIDWVKVFKR